jgi:hypothetical protein
LTEEQQASFSGWARVEIMGKQTHIGFVKTEVYGTAVLFRIDTPGLPEREYVLTEPGWASGHWSPAGTKVKRPERPGSTVLIGAGSIYRMIPCTEAAALMAIEQLGRGELQLVDIRKAIAPAIDEEEERDETDPYTDDPGPQFYSPDVAS